MHIFNSIFSKSFLPLQSVHSGNLLSKLTVDAEAISKLYPNVYADMVGNFSLLILGIVSLFVLNWKMALVLLGVTPLLLFSVALVTPHLKKAIMKDREVEEDSRTYMQEVLTKFVIFKTYSMKKMLMTK